MERYFKRLPGEIQDLISQVRQIAAARKLKAYLVGGFVRDLILGVKNLDLDFVIEGDAIKFAEGLAGFYNTKITAHKQFGTATFFIKPNLKIDFSSARKEAYPKPADLPVVKLGSLKDDLFRRDFTINAMAMSLSDYWLIDYFGGKVDLRNKKIRVLHDLSFIDDPTRILRAVRFEQRYNFQIEPKTMEFLKESVKLRMLEKVQPHRTRDDLILVLEEARPIKEIKRLEKLTGFDFIYPGLKITARTYFLLRACEKEINWFRKNYPERRALDSWVIYLISLLDSVSIKIINKISAKFGLRKGEEKRILTYKEAEKRLVCDLSKVKIKPSKLFALLEPLSYETILVLRARHKNFNLKRHIADFLEIYNGMRIFVSGRDLHGLGVLPGPSYLKIFTQVLNAKLNGRVKTKGEELALIKGLIKKRS